MDADIKDILVASYNANKNLREKLVLEAWKQSELDDFLAHFEKKESIRVLDVGAGAGQQSQYLRDHGLTMSCVDISSEMVQLCRNKGLDAHIMDFYSLDFDGGTFDAAWSMNALLHVPKKSLGLVLSNIAHVLQPGGIFYLGLYGGRDSEGIWEEDTYRPKRFFSFHEHEAIQEKVSQIFELIDFRVITIESAKVDYQAMLLRKP